MDPPRRNSNPHRNGTGWRSTDKGSSRPRPYRDRYADDRAAATRRCIRTLSTRCGFRSHRRRFRTSRSRHPTRWTARGRADRVGSRQTEIANDHHDDDNDADNVENTVHIDLLLRPTTGPRCLFSFERVLQPADGVLNPSNDFAAVRSRRALEPCTFSAPVIIAAVVSVAGISGVIATAVPAIVIVVLVIAGIGIRLAVTEAAVARGT